MPALSSTCDPASNLGQTVRVSVIVTDPSGVKKVVLRYQRARDASPVSVTMVLSSGATYQVTLTTATDTAAWQPKAGAYVVQLSIQATDGKGNVTTTPTVSGFSVDPC